MNLTYKSPKPKDYTNLQSKLELLVNTIGGKEWVESRYGAYYTPSQIIDWRKNKYFKTFFVYLNDKLIGYCDFTIDKKDNYLEIGYLIFPEFAGKGYGFIAAEQAFNEGFLIEGVKGVKIEVETTNLASIKILKKLAEKKKPDKTAIGKYTPPTDIYFWNKI